MSAVVCETCGGIAEVHLTEVRADGTKVSRHFCAQHAAAAGIPGLPGKFEAYKAAMEAFVRFVQRERRAPSEDELAQLGLSSSDAGDYQHWREQLNKMAEFILRHPDA